MAGPLSSLAKVIFCCYLWHLATQRKNEFYRRGAAVRKSKDVHNGISTFQKNTENGRRGAKVRFKNTDNCKSKRSVRIPQEVAILPQRGDGSEIERRPQRSGHFQEKT